MHPDDPDSLLGAIAATGLSLCTWATVLPAARGR